MKTQNNLIISVVTSFLMSGCGPGLNINSADSNIENIFESNTPSPCGLFSGASSQNSISTQLKQLTTFTTNSVNAFVGNFGGPGSLDSTATQTRLAEPLGLTIDSSDNLYIADGSNYTIRKIDSSCVSSTIAGSAGITGSTDGLGNMARFRYLGWLARDQANNLFVTDSNNQIIRKITPDGTVTTLAGLALATGSTDGTGSAARFQNPQGIAIDNLDNIYVADTLNNTIRKITPTGVVTTLAGQAGLSGTADGTGTSARFNLPTGIAVDSEFTVYVTDSNNHTIRTINQTGVVQLLPAKLEQVAPLMARARWLCLIFLVGSELIQIKIYTLLIQAAIPFVK